MGLQANSPWTSILPQREQDGMSGGNIMKRFALLTGLAALIAYGSAASLREADTCRRTQTDELSACTVIEQGVPDGCRPAPDEVFDRDHQADLLAEPIAAGGPTPAPPEPSVADSAEVQIDPATGSHVFFVRVEVEQTAY